VLAIAVGAPRGPAQDKRGQTAALYQVMRSHCNISFAGHNLDDVKEGCPFVEAGVAEDGWSGSCLPFLHNHTS
jgi:hypothetical protein